MHYTYWIEFSTDAKDYCKTKNEMDKFFQSIKHLILDDVMEQEELIKDEDEDIFQYDIGEELPF